MTRDGYTDLCVCVSVRTSMKNDGTERGQARRKQLPATTPNAAQKRRRKILFTKQRQHQQSLNLS